MTRLEDTLRDLGDRLTAPDRDLVDRIMNRIPNLPRLLHRPSDIQGKQHECPLPHQAVNDE